MKTKTKNINYISTINLFLILLLIATFGLFFKNYHQSTKAAIDCNQYPDGKFHACFYDGTNENPSGEPLGELTTDGSTFSYNWTKNNLGNTGKGKDITAVFKGKISLDGTYQFDLNSHQGYAFADIDGKNYLNNVFGGSQFTALNLSGPKNVTIIVLYYNKYDPMFLPDDASIALSYKKSKLNCNIDISPIQIQSGGIVTVNADVKVLEGPALTSWVISYGAGFDAKGAGLNKFPPNGQCNRPAGCEPSNMPINISFAPDASGYVTVNFRADGEFDSCEKSANITIGGGGGNGSSGTTPNTFLSIEGLTPDKSTTSMGSTMNEYTLPEGTTTFIVKWDVPPSYKNCFSSMKNAYDKTEPHRPKLIYKGSQTINISELGDVKTWSGSFGCDNESGYTAFAQVNVKLPEATSSECVAENQTKSANQTCCSGLIEQNGICVKQPLVQSTCISHLGVYDGSMACCSGLTPYYDIANGGYINGVCVDQTKIKQNTPGQCGKNLETIPLGVSAEYTVDCCAGSVNYDQKPIGNEPKTGGSYLCLSSSSLPSQYKPYKPAVVTDDEEDEDKTADDTDDEAVTAETWQDFSSMKDMPTIIPEPSPSNCDQVPDNEFHACYYEGKIEDLDLSPKTNKVIFGETVKGNRIDHEWGTGAIVTDLSGTQYSDNVSAIWRGRFYFPEGDFIFKTTADDGVKVNVEGAGDLIYKWYPQPRNTHISDIYHIREGWHTITVRYFEDGHKAAIKFWWEHQKPAFEAEALNAQLNLFETLIQQLQQLIDRILGFFGA